MIPEITDSPIKRVKFAREAGAVRRCHTMKTILDYDVAQHVYNAICILRVLHPSPPIHLVWAILSHDMPERFTGDIPAPAKWAGVVDRNGLKDLEEKILQASGFNYMELTNEDSSWLNGIDILELYLWCLDETSMGNQNLRRMKYRIDKILRQNTGEFPHQIVSFYWKLSAFEWSIMSDLGD